MSNKAGNSGQLALAAKDGMQNPEAMAAFVSGVERAQVFASAERSDQSFKWDDPDNPDVAVPTQGAIAVYLNEAGAVSLRQEALWNEEQDPVIYIHPRNIDALIDQLQVVKAQIQPQGKK